ncbi:AAA domain-containing protein [Natranaerobius thermophilus]|uniref:AAA domain-containing protein n=1 Tax=Natranaerobius thermophilus TaxID=375929 RepID=UPI002F426739
MNTEQGTQEHVQEYEINDKTSEEVTDISKKSSYKKIINLFEYLKAYYSLTRKQIYDVASYDTIYWYDELPSAPGCSFESTSEGEKLIIQKQSISDPKEPPASIESWIEGDWKDPSEEISVLKHKTSPTEEFTDDLKRVEDFRDWYQHWEEWREQALHKQRVHQLYQEMFLLSQNLERQQDELELVWGHGILYWKDEGKKIRHPVVTTNAILNFDEKNGQIEIISQDVENTSLELEFLNSIKNSQIRDLSKLKDEVNKMQLNPWEKTAMEELCEKLVNLLSPNGRIQFDSKKLTSDKDPMITYEPVLILRKKRVGYRQDLDDILEGLQQGKELPQTIQSIFDKDQNTTSTATMNIASEELMFPLASNEEQNQIVKRLSENTGVTVQGPPGTGKSHTIANLVSHMLAHGKRVLVTAKSERPLRVLREMIPKNIQPLCVNVFTDESNSKLELEEAVRSISETMGSLDISREENKLKKLKNTLKSIREKRASLQNKMKQISEFETSTYTINGQEFTLPQLSSWLTETEEELGWIKDEIPQDAEFPLDKLELNRLYELIGELIHEDREKLQEEIPDIAFLPKSQSLKELHNKLDKLSNEMSDEQAGEQLGEQAVELKNEASDSSTDKWFEIPEDLDVETVSDLMAELEKVTSDLKIRIDSDWLNTIFQDGKSEGIRRQQWIDLIEGGREYVNKLYELRERTAEYEIDIPYESNVGKLLETVMELETDLQKKEKIGLLQKVLNSDVRYLQQNCTIDGLAPKTLQDIQILKAELEKGLTASKLLKRWDKQVVAINGPEFNEDDPRLIEKIDDQLKVIETVIYWNETTWKPLKEKMKENNIPVILEDVDIEKLETLIENLKSTINNIKLRDVRKQLDKITELINENLENNHKFYYLWEQLASGMRHRNYELWDNTIEEIIRLKNLEDDYQEFKQLLDKVKKTSPTLAKDLERQGGDGGPFLLLVILNKLGSGERQILGCPRYYQKTPLN